MYYCLDCDKVFDHRKLIKDSNDNIIQAVCPYCDAVKTYKV